ncbi:MAG: ComEC/Rec2 family competence protein, partial [Candidatus Omnitrophota bacterium]
FNILGPLFCVSLSAWLGTAGLVAYYFGVVSLVTVLANILIVPLTSFITACGFALIISAKALPQASFLFAKSCETGVWLMWRINFILLRMTGAYFYIKAFPAAYLLGYYLLLVGFFAKLTNRGKCDTLRPI